MSTFTSDHQEHVALEADREVRQIYRAHPVNHSATLEDKNRMREAIFTYGCYCPDMTFTLNDVIAAFGYRRDKAWLRIGELRRDGRVRLLNQTRNRSVQYQILTKENLCR